MSESAISPRALSGAEEFDRRMRSIAQSSAAHSEALEELARLVGQQDPFGETHAADPQHERADAQPITQPPLDYLGHGAAYESGLDRSTEAGSPVEPAVVHPPVPEPETWEQVVPRYPSISVHDLRPVETSPDAWAQDADEDRYVPPVPVGEMREDAPARPESSNAKRTLMVLLAVMLLTGGGLAAALLKHPATTGALVDTATATPTILAATGPTKVQPETPAANADAPSEPSTLLDKNKNDGTAAAKVVNAVEQPVDLGQAMKPAAAPAEPSAPASPFPEPRKVKTILVRPDGSIIADAGLPPAEAPSAASQQANLAFDPTTAIPIAPSRTADAAPDAGSVPPDAPAPVAKPPVGKTTARVPAAKPAASTSQGGTAAAEGRSAVATPKAKPVAHLAKPKPKPVAAAAADAPAAPAADAGGPPILIPEAPAAVADATPTASAVTGQGGSFAVQLGAAPTEAEGQATAAKLSQKYAGDLGGSKPSVRKAAAGNKTVFRIRIGNLSQDEAKALCGKVQAGGGACFVARN